MDTSDNEIRFDKDGICSHCREYEERARKELHYDDVGKKRINEIVREIKTNGRSKRYNCIIGVSGGTDSTFALYILKKLDLKPLAVHLDNGWDSELSVKNIEQILKNLNIDLYTYVIDWTEFKDLQMSFLKASIANAEIPTDHAIVATLYHVAAKYGIKYIISGGNITTEAIMPDSWMYDAKDWKIIKSIHKKFGTKELKSFPHLTIFDWVHYTFFKQIKYIPILNYIPYIKKDAIELLVKEIGWRNYEGKHHESIYTKFFQNYILPKKFDIDKRRAHLSTLILSGQISREDALKEIQQDSYSDKKSMNDDIEYVIKKLGISREDLKKIMSEPKKTYKDYPNDSWFFKKNNFLSRLAKKIITRNY